MTRFTLSAEAPDGSRVKRLTNTRYGWAVIGKRGNTWYLASMHGGRASATIGGRKAQKEYDRVVVRPTTVDRDRDNAMPETRSYPAIECSKCGKLHTTLKCDGCGF